ncbi:MAG: hypothetical protein EON58_02275 [Alphaproteobacteria bacterium]|nr:MAG: hypothetical protein EON58_02275 [Alphaproteobacteria bacterium]
MKRREVSLEELWQRPAVTVLEAGKLTGYSRNVLYARMDAGLYAWSYSGRSRMIVTESLREAEVRLAEKRAGGAK